jgi:hypothetical protein
MVRLVIGVHGAYDIRNGQTSGLGPQLCTCAAHTGPPEFREGGGGGSD